MVLWIRSRAAKRFSGVWRLCVASVVLLPLACDPGSDRSSGGGTPPPSPSQLNELTALGIAAVNGRWVEVPVEGEGATRAIVQPAGSALELFVRVPARAELVVDAVEPSPAVVEVESDAHREVVELARSGQGTWTASLAAFSGQMARLRFPDPGSGPRRWVRPRIESPEPGPAPILEVAPRPEGLRPNVIVYVIDTLRADRMSAYGYERETSPNFETLAKSSSLFFSAYAPGPHTVPSITSLFGSRYASELSGRLDPAGAARHTLAEIFQGAGFQTAAFQANFLLFPAHGYARGFDEYRVIADRSNGPVQKATAAEIQAAALDWLSKRSDEPFFLYLQTMDVHYPYDPPDPFYDLFTRFKRDVPIDEVLAQMSPEELAALESMGEISVNQAKALSAINPDVYDGCIAYADHELWTFIQAVEAAGLGDDTIIAVTSDHGEPLWQRGESNHGMSLYEELVHIPLLLSVPWDRKPRRIESVVNMRALAPTLLELAGVEAPEDYPGRSLLLPPEASTADFSVGERLQFRTNKVLAWYARQGHWKMIIDREGPHLYDLSVDPGEENDVRMSHPIVAAYLEALIRSQSPALAPGAKRAVPLDHGLGDAEIEALEEALRSLGYAE